MRYLRSSSLQRMPTPTNGERNSSTSGIVVAGLDVEVAQEVPLSGQPQMRIEIALAAEVERLERERRPLLEKGVVDLHSGRVLDDSGPQRTPTVGERKAEEGRPVVAPRLGGQVVRDRRFHRAVRTGQRDDFVLLGDPSARIRHQLEAIEPRALVAVGQQIDTERRAVVLELREVGTVEPELELQLLHPVERGAERIDALLDAAERAHQLVVRLRAVDQFAERPLAAGDLGGDLVQVVDRGLHPLADVLDVGDRVLQSWCGSPPRRCPPASASGRSAR